MGISGGNAAGARLAAVAAAHRAHRRGHRDARGGLRQLAADARRAGPLAKGSNLCHGTAVNGYAFLALHRRTGDARWLERARAFAMHAIGQFEAAREHHGMLRASLWTGDPGLAIYLWDCVRGAGAFPTLEVFDGR